MGSLLAERFQEGKLEPYFKDIFDVNSLVCGALSSLD